MFYNLDGIPSAKPPPDKFWFHGNQDQIILKEGDITTDIGFTCIGLHDLLAQKIFKDRNRYYELVGAVPIFFAHAGIDAEANISKEDFEKIVSKIGTDEIPNKFLYYFDSRNLIYTLNNSLRESYHLLGQFYKVFNEDDFMLNMKPFQAEGVQYATGTVVANITALLNHIFINLYSQLDFITKIHYEFENIATDFSKYPKLKSSNILYGDRNKLKHNGLSNSLFDNAETIRTIITIRNEIVHNASFDSMPKVYQVVKNSQIIEKFILFPDMENGIIKTYKNRKRFFNNEVKLNELLPGLVIDFWNRLKVTLECLS